VEEAAGLTNEYEPCSLFSYESTKKKLLKHSDMLGFLKNMNMKKIATHISGANQAGILSTSRQEPAKKASP
jgi:hypothetical protein